MGKLEVDQDLIRELAALLEETGLGEIEIADDDKRLRVARPSTVIATAPATAAAHIPGPAAAPIESSDEAFAEHPGAVTSPMVGTVYRALEPGAAPFVNVGQQISKGQTLLIIEAMKTFNEIPAPKDGTIAQILVENASPVEFGEVLLLIE